jgi:CRISPR-associated endoribonuclease Cas6
MNTRLKIKLIIPEGYDFGTSKSSLLHGVISQLIPGEYAGEMHTAGDHPYSQYVISDNDSWYWVVNTLDERAAENIIRPLKELDQIHIEHNDVIIGLGERELTEISTDELFLKYGMNAAPKKTELRFVTPASFKSGGAYVNIPGVRLIMQSVIRKYDRFSGNSIYSEELMQEVENRVLVSSYSLRSASFPLEGVNIPAFTGRMTLYVRGGGALPGLVRMLCEYSKFFGIGIKTALGMGAISTR